MRDPARNSDVDRTVDAAPIVLPSVGNRMLAFAHDDGWRLSLFCADWEPVRAPLQSLAGRLTNASIDAFDRPSESEAIRVTATGVPW